MNQQDIGLRIEGRPHDKVLVQQAHCSGQVDATIAPLVLEILKAGLWPSSCCENRRGFVWLQFARYDFVSAFLGYVASDNGIGPMDNPPPPVSISAFRVLGGNCSIELPASEAYMIEFYELTYAERELLKQLSPVTIEFDARLLDAVYARLVWHNKTYGSSDSSVQRLPATF